MLVFRVRFRVVVIKVRVRAIRFMVRISIRNRF